MKKKSDYSNIMEYIKDWCITVIYFKLEMNETPTEVKKLYEPLINGLISNFNSKDKNIQRGFKEAYKSLQEEVDYWPDKMKTDLNNILYSKFGENIKQDKDNEIKKILKRGKINNDDEFRMIDEKVNEICQISSKLSELEKLNHLLLMYERGKIQ
jgi:hypothetical protein